MDEALKVIVREQRPKNANFVQQSPYKKSET